MSFAVPTVTPERSAQMRDASVRPTAPIGTSGKPLYGGRVYGFEHNTRLQGPQKLMEAYRKAERSPAVAAGWSCLRNFMLSANWDVEPAGEGTEAGPSELALKCAEHVRDNLGIGRKRSATGKSWEKTLSGLLAAELRGFGVWELVCREGKNGVWYTHLLWRDPGSVSAFIVDEWEELVGIEQSAGWLTGRHEIPMSRLLFLSREAEGTNFEGVALVRPVEPFTRDLTTTLQALMAAVQRWALGTPDLVVDKKEWLQTHPGGTDGQWKAEVALWEGMLDKYMGYERNRIVREPWAQLGTYGGEVNAAAFDQIVNLLYRLTLTGFLAQFLHQGASGSGGSFALVQTHADVAVQAGENTLERFRDDLNTNLIPRMVRWGVASDVPDEELPTLTFSGLRAAAWQDHLDKIPALFAAAGVTPTTELVNEILAALGFKTKDVDRTPGERLRGMAPGRPPVAPPPGPVAIRPAAVTP